jgi:hypothetical protein
MESFPCMNCIFGNSRSPKLSHLYTWWHHETMISCPLQWTLEKHFIIMAYILALFNRNTILAVQTLLRKITSRCVLPRLWSSALADHPQDIRRLFMFDTMSNGSELWSCRKRLLPWVLHLSFTLLLTLAHCQPGSHRVFDEQSIPGLLYGYMFRTLHVLKLSASGLILHDALLSSSSSPSFPLLMRGGGFRVPDSLRYRRYLKIVLLKLWRLVYTPHFRIPQALSSCMLWSRGTLYCSRDEVTRNYFRRHPLFVLRTSVHNRESELCHCIPLPFFSE